MDVSMNLHQWFISFLIKNLEILTNLLLELLTLLVPVLAQKVVGLLHAQLSLTKNVQINLLFKIL